MELENVAIPDNASENRLPYILKALYIIQLVDLFCFIYYSMNCT